MTQNKPSVLIIGSGAAGLACALRCAQFAEVTLLSKTELTSGATKWAQGGIAAAMGPNDHPQKHIDDTLASGQNLCNYPIVEEMIHRASDCIEWLANIGVNFSKDNYQQYEFGQEGAHQEPRILHTHDATGLALATALYNQVSQHQNITLLPDHIGIDLIIKDHCCLGLTALNIHSKNIVQLFASHTILATGGASKVYLYTTQPESASGDGMAMAYRAGCRLIDMSFNQFHPTCLYHPTGSSSLLTEAIRGAGGILTLPNGQRFMDQYDPRGELATRDIIARAMDQEMKTKGLDHLYLDISHRPSEWLERRFPNCVLSCQKFGYDITKQPVPVVPAAHYTCGGVFVHGLSGQTDIQQLFAIGETSCTGLHGANRLASNSLLECLIMAQACAKNIGKNLNSSRNHTVQDIPKISLSTSNQQEVIVSHAWQSIRQIMWDHVGIVRHADRLKFAHMQVQNYAEQLEEYWQQGHRSPDLIECRNLATIALTMIVSASQRTESRGLHFRQDYPNTQKKWDQRHISIKKDLALEQVSLPNTACQHSVDKVEN